LQNRALLFYTDGQWNLFPCLLDQRQMEDKKKSIKLVVISLFFK
jgi:hypothetical protein